MSNDALNRRGWYESAGSAAGGKSPEGEGPLASHEAPGDPEDKKWGHIVGRSGRANRRAHVGRELSWSTKPGGLNIPENMPPGGTLTPQKDIGALSQEETFRVFQNPIKIPKKQIMRAADALPFKEKSK
jgi:hypothetical protein